MPKARNLKEENKANALYQRGEEDWRRGHLRSAFRFFLAAGKAGSEAARSTIGCFYDQGMGVKADEDAALHWYRLAYRSGSNLAANNMGCIWRDRGKIDRALMWFRRAVRLGDGDASLEIAKIYLKIKPDLKKALYYLHKVLRAKYVTEWSKDEAKRLLKETREIRIGLKTKPRGLAQTSPSKSARRRHFRSKDRG